MEEVEEVEVGTRSRGALAVGVGPWEWETRLGVPCISMGVVAAGLWDPGPRQASAVCLVTVCRVWAVTR